MEKPEANPSGAVPPSPDPQRRWASRLARQAVALAAQRARESLRDALDAIRRGARWAWARRPLPARAVAIAWCSFTALLGAFCVLEQARLPVRLPSPLDWAAARTLVERDARPGDAVALSPAWAERARQVLPASLPLLARSRYAGEDLVGVRRVWLLSMPRAPGFSWDVEVDLLERASRSDPPEKLGAIVATRYDLAFPTLPLAFLPDRLAGASATAGGAACPPDGGGALECPGTARVERAVREVGAAPRACIVATLRGDAPAPLVLEFPSIRIGRVVHGHAAPAPERAAGPVRVAVQIDGEEAGVAEMEGGWRPFQIDTTRFAGQRGTLSLVLTAPGAGPICLDAMTLP